MRILETQPPTPAPIVLASPYGKGSPSTRVRLYEWADHLGFQSDRLEFAGLSNNTVSNIARHPARVGYALASTEWRPWRLRGRRIILSREVSPFSRGRAENRLFRSAEYAVYDLDDALFADTVGLRSLYGKREKCAAAASAADVVIAGNEYLADWLAQFSSDVRVIPTCVEPGAYQPKDTWEVSDQPRLIWLGSPSTEKYVVGISSALREVHRRTGARVTIISGSQLGEVDRALETCLDRVPWSAETVAGKLREGDVAIAPLDDDPFARGKCAYKVLQYAASGLPIVGSPVGANRQALNRFHGWAASTLDEWVDALCDALASGSQQLEHRAIHGLESVKRYYSYAAWADAWSSAVLRAS